MLPCDGVSDSSKCLHVGSVLQVGYVGMENYLESYGAWNLRSRSGFDPMTHTNEWVNFLRENCDHVMRNDVISAQDVHSAHVIEGEAILWNTGLIIVRMILEQFYNPLWYQSRWGTS